MSKNSAITPYDKFKGILTQTIKATNDFIPADINAEMLKVNALMYIQNNKDVKDLAEANPVQIAQFVFNFVVQGLDMLNREAYIVSYKGKPTPVIDYKGLKKIAMKYSVKPIKLVESGVIRENDVYSYRDGKFTFDYDPFLSNEERGALKGAYCIIKFEDGEVLNTFANKDEILKVKNASPSSKSNYSPWQNWEESMWEKTVIRKAMKYINLDFKGNDVVSRAYQESDKDFEPNNPDNARKTIKEVKEQKEPEYIDAEVEVVDLSDL